MAETTNAFADAAGRTWTCRVTTKTARRLRDEIGVNILDISKDNFALLQSIMSDPILLADILWVVCGEQHDITADEFGEALLGDTIEQAAHALLRGVVDFFPTCRQRRALTAIMDKAEDVDAAMATMMEADLEALDKMSGQEIAQQIVQSGAATSTLESSE